MPRNLSYQSKAIIILIVVVIGWLLLPGFLKRWSQPVFATFNAPSAISISYLRDLQNYWELRSQSKGRLIESAIELARGNAALSLSHQRIDTLMRENRAWEEFFNLPPEPDYRFEVARVVQRDLNAWWQTLVIRKGTHHGIRPGQAVVFTGGVVGRVYSANHSTAVVELLSSPRFRSAAHFEGDRRPVEFTGRINHGLRPASGQVSTVPADITVSIERPLRLMSSRLGGIFPDGLVLGYVYHLDPTPDGLFQRGTVRLDPRLLELREVAVLVPLDPSP